MARPRRPSRKPRPSHILASGLALALAGVVVANCIVVRNARTHPERAAMVWPEHPAVALPQGLAGLDRRRRADRPIGKAMVDSLTGQAWKSPLSPAPFLAAAMWAEEQGDRPAALAAMALAVRRAPADVEVRRRDARLAASAGLIDRAVDDLDMMVRMRPDFAVDLGPLFAAIVDDPGARPAVMRMIAESPVMADSVLSAMAADPARASDVMALAPRRGPASLGDPDAHWPDRLIATLVAAGRIAPARALWQARRGGRGDKALLVDPLFTDRRAAPPFGWTLTVSGDGQADRGRVGSLSLLSRGSGELVLAEQLLALAPGRYRLASRLSDLAGDGSFAWRLRCQAGGAALAELPLTTGRRAGEFTVAGCAAQRLQLVARAPDLPGTTTATLAGLALERLP